MKEVPATPTGIAQSSDHRLSSVGRTITTWRPVTAAPPLGDGELHLWRLDMDGDTPQQEVEELLSASERSRAKTVNNPEARRTYTRARAAKRRILGGYLGIPPDRLQLSAGPRGKPYIAAPDTDIYFNLTHSGGLALLAVMRGREVGLDAERVRPRRGLLRIARRMFGPEQAESLDALPREEQQRQFHVHWTRLEAGVKALGGGLFDPDSRDDSGLNFASFVPLPGYQACMATPGECPAPGGWLTLTYRI